MHLLVKKYPVSLSDLISFPYRLRLQVLNSVGNLLANPVRSLKYNETMIIEDGPYRPKSMNGSRFRAPLVTHAHNIDLKIAL